MTRRKRCASTHRCSRIGERYSDAPFRCLTVNSPQGVPGVELVLEPMNFPPAHTYQKALCDAGIPASAFLTEDIQAEFARLKERGVIFHGELKSLGPIISVIFEDRCGNLVNLVQPLL
jgi:hypothetical protein